MQHDKLAAVCQKAVGRQREKEECEGCSAEGPGRRHTPMGVIALCLRCQGVILAVCLGLTLRDLDTETPGESRRLS